jgi:GH35 family endo-1,4-beta-xylanase
MMINEVTSFNFIPAEKNPYVAQIKKLLVVGAQIRGIGLQYHYFRREALDKFLASANCNPAKLLDLYEALADFKLPLYITEITIPSAGPDGDALQTQVVSDHYRLWFSAPTMAGITWWNLGDGTAVKGENEAMGGLMDGGLKPKGAYRALDRLINEEWKTKAMVQTDAQGTARVHGFYGQYEVTVVHNGVTKKFPVAHANRGGKVHLLSLKP